MNKLKEFWNGLTAKNKRFFAVLGVAVVIVCIGLLGYSGRKASVKPRSVRETKKDIALDSELLKKSTYTESQKEIAEMKKQMEEIKEEKKKSEEEKKKADEAVKKSSFYPKGTPGLPPPVPGLTGEGSKKSAPLAGVQPFTPPRAPMYPPAYPQSPQGKPGQPPVVQEVLIGGIEIVAAPADPKKKDEPDKKKENRKVFLPISYMEATLLSGLDAPVTEKGKSHPVPVMLRIKDIAVLPNDVKADLKGCFVIAHGIGSLETERAELKLVSISCLSKKGQAVIDSRVTGYIVDEDGKIGLQGIVVSKMGALIARSMLAGFLGGVGDVVKQSASVQSVSPLGSTNTLKGSDVLRAGVGGGIAQAAVELQKFYLELARMSMPVISVGASKTVTLVISQGVDLEIISKNEVKK